jgi:hypothetical protein
MRQWDGATGDAETTDRIVEGLIGLGAAPQVTQREIPRPAEPRPAMPGSPAPAAMPGARGPETPGATAADLPAPEPLPPLATPAPLPPLPEASGPDAEPVVHTQEVPTGSIPHADPSPGTAAEAYDPAVFGRLRAWRQEAARQASQKAFYVFPDATLKRIAAARPQTLEDLAAVKGVGPRKLEQYGQDVLDTINRGEEEE